MPHGAQEVCRETQPFFVLEDMNRERSCGSELMNDH
jgi:hypothetical protein